MWRFLRLTRLWNVVFGQHRLQNLGEVQGCVEICLATDPRLTHYGELHHADLSLLLNKKDGSQFGIVTRSDGARHLRNSVRELSDQASCFPKYKVALSLSAGSSHSITNWHRPVSCADDNERNTILLAIDDYHQKTAIRFKPYDPSTDVDYGHITGADSGCWSYVGRIGGVSNTIQGVVKKSSALRTASLGFCSFNPTLQKNKQKSTVVYIILNPIQPPNPRTRCA